MKKIGWKGLLSRPQTANGSHGDGTHVVIEVLLICHQQWLMDERLS
jgi:hypothetical protein